MSFATEAAPSDAKAGRAAWIESRLLPGADAGHFARRGQPRRNGYVMIPNVACEVRVYEPPLVMPLPEGASEKSFYAFLFHHRHDATPVGDLGGEVCADPHAPKANTRLIDYLNRKSVDQDALEAALRGWTGDAE
jgi:hypothetical protein